MKRSWMVALVITLFSSHSLLAADARFCDQYAKTSIKQQLSNIVGSCSQTGLRWSTFYAAQNAWCGTVRKSIAENETKARNDALAKCGAPLSKKNWQDDLRASGKGYSVYNKMREAVKKDDVVAVKFLKEQGVPTTDNAGDNDGGLLYFAVDNQAEKVSKYLLTLGMRPSQIPNGGGNALAAMIGNPKVNYRMLAMLLKNGFDPNYGGEGYSDTYYPVMQAAIKNNYRVMQILLKAGGDPNTMRNSSALVYAIKNRNMSMVSMLLNAGAKVNKVGNDDDCVYPLDHAFKSGSLGLVNLLKSKGAKRAKCGQ